MSTVEGAVQCDEGEYGRAAKRLKTEETEAEEREEGEEELEEGEDSDSGSLPDNGESATDNRARWSASQFGAGRRENGEDSHRISPSPVVHVRGLCEAVVEADLIDALERFGPICCTKPEERKALQRVVTAAQTINGCPLPSLEELYTSCCFSKAKRISQDPSYPGHTVGMAVFRQTFQD